MPGLTGAALTSAKYSQLAGALFSDKSIWSRRGNQALTPFFIDDTVFILQSNGVAAPLPLSTVQFNLPKNSTLIGRCHVEVTLSAGRDSGTINANTGFHPELPYNAVTNFPIVEYVKNVGDQVFQQHSLIYGNATLQQFDGVFHYIWRRLTKNDVNIEAQNAMVLGGLPPGGNYDTGPERVLVDAWYRGVTLEVPLEEFYWVNQKDQYWMPESLALEGQLRHVLAPNGSIMNTRNHALTDILNAGRGLMPTITNCVLRYQEVTLSAAEKENMLKLYRTPEGAITHFLDLETQLGSVIAGTGVRAAPAAGIGGSLALQPAMLWNVPLNNLRMDMAEIIFVIHRLTNAAVVPGAVVSPSTFPGEEGTYNPAGPGFSGSYAESNNLVQSILYNAAPAGQLGAGFATQINITEFKLQAAGKDLLSLQPQFWNRTFVRKYYHLDSQIGDNIFIIPFAAFCEDRFNATGSMAASVLGNLNLQITLPNPGSQISYQCDVYVHSHNLIQCRAGGTVKALN